MTIERAGKWWRGDGSQDFRDFLKETWSAATKETRFPQCESCGCLVYRLSVQPGRGARRACVACGASAGVCGSDASFAASEAPVRVTCECGKNQFEIAVASTGEGSAVMRIAVARRCLACGILDLCAEWPAPAGSTDALMDRA